MLEESARLALAGTRFTDVRWFEEVDSTNRLLADLAREGAPEGVVVVADHQLAGRGRLGRRWDAPPGTSVLLSVLLRPALTQAHVPLTTLVLSLAASDACAEVAAVTVGIKWPNDLVVDGGDGGDGGGGGGGKVGGILGETVVAAGLVGVVVGIGLNVNWPEPPPEPGVALNQLTGHPVDRTRLVVSLLRHLERRYDRLDQPGGTDELFADYRARSATLGREVRVELWAGGVEGTAVDVTPEGHLVVEEVGGRRRMVAAGDVMHLRPA